MLITAVMLGFIILAMFFAMLVQTPKSDPEPLPIEVRDSRTQ